MAPGGGGTTHTLQNLESDDEVWTAAGSPHVIDYGLTIREGQKLTVEPCAVVQLKAGIGILVQGELVADGEEDRPIAFERAADAAWSKIYVQKTGSARLAFAKLVGGGAPSTTAIDRTATLLVEGDPHSPDGVQPLARVDHVTISGSESLGMLLSQNGAFSDDSRDLTITGSASAPVRLWQRAVSSLPTGRLCRSGRDDERG